MTNCYFSHDSNARNSKKMLRLRKEHGAEGYGTYFMLLERLREEQDFVCDADYEMLSYDLRVPADTIQSVVENFGLFAFNEEHTRFYSTGFNERMNIKDKRSQAGTKGAEARWGAKTEIAPEMAQNGKNMANVMANEFCHDLPYGTSSDKEKKSKEKESKEKDYCSSSQTPPAGAEEGAEEGFEEQQQEIILSFFEKNYRAPVEEYRKMVNYNSTGGRDWQKMSRNQRRATAELWRQKPDEPKRFPQSLLSLWSALYRNAKSLGANASVLSALLSDRLDLRTRGDTLVMRCSSVLYDYIEIQNLDSFRTIFRTFFDSNRLSELNYDIIDNIKT